MNSVDITRYNLLKHKNQTEGRIKKFVAMVKNKFDERVKKTRCGRGGEYIKKKKVVVIVLSGAAIRTYPLFWMFVSMRVQFSFLHQPDLSWLLETVFLTGISSENDVVRSPFCVFDCTSVRLVFTFTFRYLRFRTRLIRLY